MTKTEDKFRPAYGRQQVVRSRQCVFIGTTNANSYLRDETGGRRFWPVHCGRIDLDALSNDRDQLLAEAVVAYRGGARWWPDREFEQQHIVPEQAARYDQDEWHDAVMRYIRTRDRVQVQDILREALLFAQKDIRREGLSRCFRRDQNLVGGGVKTAPSHCMWAAPEPEG